jgi:hypothetical protein
VRELPLAISGGVKQEGKYQILLFETEQSYNSAGGPPGSAGVFIGGKNIVMVPLTSLGVRPVGSGYMLDRDKSNKTLPHELVHQLTPDNYYAHGSMGWFTEGLAEYVAVTDDEAMAAFHNLCRTEGIIPALETSHGLAYAEKLAKTLNKDQAVLVNLSGRGDKDINTVAKLANISL